MLAKRVSPILNVSNIDESFSWFGKLGWARRWEWGTRHPDGHVFRIGTGIEAEP